MSSNIKWDVWPHPKNGDLKVLVAFAWLSGNPRQRRPAASTILCMIPLYDLRDLNYDGKYSWAESLNPFGGALAPMNEAELMIHIGMDLKDGDFVQLGRMKALNTAFRLADQAFRKTYLLPRLTGPAETALKAFKLDVVTDYIIKQTIEKAVEKLLGID